MAISINNPCITLVWGNQDDFKFNLIAKRMVTIENQKEDAENVFIEVPLQDLIDICEYFKKHITTDL